MTMPAKTVSTLRERSMPVTKVKSNAMLLMAAKTRAASRNVTPVKPATPNPGMTKSSSMIRMMPTTKMSTSQLSAKHG